MENFKYAQLAQETFVHKEQKVQYSQRGANDIEFENITDNYTLPVLTLEDVGDVFTL